MTFAFTPPFPPTVQIEGESVQFPVRRIWCVGRNYADHAREMGHDPDREPPFFFGKPADAVAPGGGILAFPSQTQDLHHEVELAVALHGGGENLTPAQGLDAVFGYGLALDMTRRDLQAEAKAKSRPWDMAKGFDQSCPIGALRRANGQPARGAILLKVNGQVRQSGRLDDMIWSVGECLAALSRLVRLAPGDILLTGTPAGVGPVLPGDILEAESQAAPSLCVTYLAHQGLAKTRAHG